jgi:hypothetical protein
MSAGYEMREEMETISFVRLAKRRWNLWQE